MVVCKAFIVGKSNVNQQKLPCLNIVKKNLVKLKACTVFEVVVILICNTISKDLKREFILIFDLKFCSIKSDFIVVR